MKNQNDRFGINIIKFCKDHEAYINERLEKADDLKELLEYHNRKTEWLQHERLIHLLVTMLTAIAFFSLVFLEIYLNGNAAVLFLLAIVFVLLAAYLFHYFRLENTVQHWYMISEEIYRKSEKKGTDL